MSSLNNLISTAHHVRNIAGFDWFDDLRPFAEYALYTRLPNGDFPAFEEGVPAVFPFDVLAGEYPVLTPALLWAWDNSGQDASNYEVQQIHSASPASLSSTSFPPRKAP